MKKRLEQLTEPWINRLVAYLYIYYVQTYMPRSYFTCQSALIDMPKLERAQVTPLLSGTMEIELAGGVTPLTLMLKGIKVKT